MPPHDIWELCNSEADICLGAKCSHYENCFFYRARRQAATAQLLIVNHHLLFADLGLPAGFGLLPKYEAVVLDEAHHLEDVATGYLGENASRFGLTRVLGRLSHRKRTNSGVLARIYLRLQQILHKHQHEFLENLLASLDADILPAVGFIAGEMGDFFSRWQAAFLQLEAETNQHNPATYKRRITEGDRSSDFWQDEIMPPAQELREFFAPLFSALSNLDKGIEEGIRDGMLPVETFDFLLAELRGVSNRLRQYVGVFSRFFLAEERDPGLIYWVEISHGRRLNLKVIIAPLDVGEVLVEKFYACLETVVVTSATLAVGRDFGYFLERSGLSRLPSARSVETLLLDSPFDYQKNCRLLVPRDLPTPGRENYRDQLSIFLAELIKTVGGRTMVLFTSYVMMNQVTLRCRELLAGQGFLLFQQGEGQRHKLLHDFKNNPAAVLLATASFWEGVDVKGRALETLVIVRLPFKVPTEPVVQARSEFISSRGGDPFRDYALPQAAISLKQGVGRLIRSQEDRGLVVITDERIVTKNYGLRLRESLPMQNIHYQSQGSIVDLAREFFQHGWQ
jgi:ATP-dependent DNA helicase DinG